MDFNKFAFDLDGTLVDDHFKLRKGVDKLFHNILTTTEDAEILICTGTSLKKALTAVEMIEKSLAQNYGYDKKLDITYALYAGALIYKNGEYLESHNVTLEQFEEIKEISKSIDQNTVIFVSTGQGMFYEKPKPISKDNAKMKAIKLLQASKGQGGFDLYPKSAKEIEDYLRKGSVYSLEVLSLSSTKKKQILNALRENINDLTFSQGTTIQVSESSKLKAITKYIDKNPKNVFYVGDGFNDIEPLKECGLTFALGEKLEVLKAGKYAVQEITDINDIVFEGKNFEEISEKLIAEAEKKDRKKQEIKEKGRLKVAIEKMKKSNTNDEVKL